MAAPTEKEKMLKGELYNSLDPTLVRERARCRAATARYNNAGNVSVRRRVELWREWGYP